MHITKQAMTLGAALSKRRLRLKMNLREAARKIGVMSHTQFDNLEKGKAFNPCYVVMVGICRFLDCDLNTLGRFIAASQLQAGTITTGNSSAELGSKKRTEARRNTFFNVLYPEENK